MRETFSQSQSQDAGPLLGALSIRETATTLSLGLTSVYKLLKDGRLARIKVGRRTLIPIASIDALLRG